MTDKKIVSLADELTAVRENIVSSTRLEFFIDCNGEYGFSIENCLNNAIYQLDCIHSEMLRLGLKKI